MNRLDGGLNVAEGGQNDGRRHIAIRPESLHQLETIHSRHHQIGDDDIGRKRSELLERLLAIGSCLYIEAPGSNHRGERSALGLFVVDNENIYGLACGHGL